ncbi:GntR family transcriptional regulator [Pollutimonas bauzanensis]|uniref:DNA-binding transcriptional regulator, GntR family n=1 Tax=Pollutimonas bauzanensis TaxID=658167 RepID=A0A1M5YPZ9_9BURK|nr:GntR family transcriptional regulator [Pollutimonas bauzanensis]SHI13613.1 DNA-binding transcriptional regulator, GntR family [Pollutimonas bauzanensis]
MANKANDKLITGPLRSANEGQTSLQEQTYTLLREMITKGQIQPGDRLMEAQVAHAFGISRSPARHALTLLCKDKLVEAHGKRGYHVSGKPAGTQHNRMARLELVKLTVPRQWELIYKEVEQDLIIRMLFGSVRINEMRLAQHYDVSRTVTRDLLAHMHGVGMISKDIAGHWVARQVTPERIRHLYELRSILEPQALLGSAPYLPASLLDEFRGNILSALENGTIDSAHFDHVENDLHVRALSFCPNKEILGALNRTHFLFGPTRYLTNEFLGIPLELIREAIEEHKEIIDLLIAKKPEQSAQALQKHLSAAVDRWLLRFEITAKMAKLKLPPYLTRLDAHKQEAEERQETA